MRFVLPDGREYTAVSLLDSTLNDIIAIDREVAPILRAAGVDDTSLVNIERIRRELARPPFTDDPLAIYQHPAHLVVLGVVLWLARRAAGDTVTYQECCDFPFRDLRVERDPGEAPGPQKPPAKKAAAKKTAKRSAKGSRSGRAAAPARSAAKAPRPSASKRS